MKPGDKYLNKEIEHIHQSGKILFTDGTGFYSEKLAKAINLKKEMDNSFDSLIDKIDETIEWAKESKEFDWNKIIEK